ncbi:MAG: hypothetical protein JO089_03600 [Alphaproteobacteria bacterium]|nr:hypothetical protein [Alphaproteobacteria bacterium]
MTEETRPPIRTWNRIDQFLKAHQVIEHHLLDETMRHQNLYERLQDECEAYIEFISHEDRARSMKDRRK